MKEKHLTNYRLTPSVVKSKEKTKITITPLGENSEFFEGLEYEIQIWGTETAMDSLGGPEFDSITLKSQDGKLTFNYTFDCEQQYSLKLIQPKNMKEYYLKRYEQRYHSKCPKHVFPLGDTVLSLYCVDEDLYGMTVYKGDFHLHSFDSDGAESKANVMGNLKKAGYDFTALTDHYWYYSSVEAREIFKEYPDVFTILPGEEVHMEREYIHSAVIGGRESVNSFYYENKEKCDAEIRGLETALSIPEGVDKHNFACRYWVAQKAKEFGAMPVLSHPYWIWQNVYFMSEKITKAVFEQGNYEAFELLNGCCGRQTNNMQTAFYFEERAKGFSLPVVGSSDSHCTDRKYDYLPTPAYTLVFAKDRTWDSIHEAVLSYRSVAVEHYEEDENFRVYGDFRMVKYANFLLLNYYPDYINLCFEQGNLMKEYARTKDPETVKIAKKLKARSDAFTKAFFGRQENEIRI